jgi:hypothetical protein
MASNIDSLFLAPLSAQPLSQSGSKSSSKKQKNLSVTARTRGIIKAS